MSARVPARQIARQIARLSTRQIARLRGHVMSIAPTLRHRALPFTGPPERPFVTSVADERRGSVTLTGRLHEQPGADTIVVIVHGLGGNCQSYYTILAAAAAYARGFAALRLNLRGADGSGADLYHSGLTGDVHAAFASDALSGYRRILLLGYSIGGHISLRVASEDSDPRLTAVAAIHSPLDLTAASVAIDRPRAIVYRQYLLRQLKVDYRAVHRRHGGPIPVTEAARIHTFGEWDDRITAPVFGFAGARDYYCRASALRRLGHLQRPTLLIGEQRDPIVPASVIAPYLDEVYPRLTVRWTDRGGHVGYPHHVRLLRTAGADSMEGQYIDWLSSTPRE